MRRALIAPHPIYVGSYAVLYRVGTLDKELHPKYDNVPPLLKIGKPAEGNLGTDGAANHADTRPRILCAEPDVAANFLIRYEHGARLGRYAVFSGGIRRDRR